jgi:hypothetical protein
MQVTCFQKKALLLIVMTPFGITIDVRDSQPKKASLTGHMVVVVVVVAVADDEGLGNSTVTR